MSLAEKTQFCLAEKCQVGAEGIDNLKSALFAEFGIYGSTGPEAIELAGRRRILIGIVVRIDYL